MIIKSSLILINPWIYDFAAYDLWSKPLGLLQLAGFLRNHGFKIDLIDCMDTHHPDMENDSAYKKPVRRDFGTGKYWRKKVAKPSILSHIPRQYSRYGLSDDIFLAELEKVSQPTAILVTSLMTYWYPGVIEAIRMARQIHPHVPVFLGGIYARLCHDHATRNSGADFVISQAGSLALLLELLGARGIIKPSKPQVSEMKDYPAFDLLKGIDYICISTSSGCPLRCRYCASNYLTPDYTRRHPMKVLEEIIFWHLKYGLRDFAFYDDALLMESDTHIKILLENLIQRHLNLRFHTPNAMHVKQITPQLARLMYQAGFRTIRLGFETSNFILHKELDNKFLEGDFEQAVNSLLKAGFTSHDIGAYILVGLPDQDMDSVMESIDYVSSTGIMPYLAEYSPIPHTSLWEKALLYSSYDLISEPLFHNNSILPCWEHEKIMALPDIKKRVFQIRQEGR